jgi:hypothetical protein
MSLLLITAETLARAAMDGWASLKRQAARRRTVVALSALDGRTAILRPRPQRSPEKTVANS